jgi:hypothetical protein
MGFHAREMLLHVVHTHFESLVASWFHGQHDPEHEMLVVRTEQSDGAYRCHGEFWSVEDIDASLGYLQDDAGILRHDLFMQGLECLLPLLILLPETVLPKPPSLALHCACSGAAFEFGEEL